MIWFGFTAAFFWCVGFFILYRVPVCKKNKNASASFPKTSVIIPARNEENNLPILLDSLKKQTVPPDEIIVVDDSSEDQTPRIAEEYGALVVASSSTPQECLGKSWSCQQGAEKAKGDILIFLDADTYPEKDGFQNIMETFTKAPGVVSILPYHKVKKPYESFSAFFNLMQMIGMRSFSLLKNREPSGMFGPCLAISSEDYKKCGGHRAVCGEVLETFSLASILKQHQIPICLFGGKGSLNVRMYPDGLQGLIQGWAKSFTAGAGKTPKLTLRLSIMWMSGLLITAVMFLTSCFSCTPGRLAFWSAVYVLYALQLYIQFRRAGNFPLWSAVFYPVNLGFFFSIFTWAGYRMYRKKETSWKGRNIAKK